MDTADHYTLWHTETLLHGQICDGMMSLQGKLANRIVVQKAERKLSLAFFLFRNREWYQNKNLVYPCGTTIINAAKTKIRDIKAFSTVAALVRIHPISLLDVMWMITNIRRTYTKHAKQQSRNKSACIQADLF